MYPFSYIFWVIMNFVDIYIYLYIYTSVFIIDSMIDSCLVNESEQNGTWLLVACIL